MLRHLQVFCAAATIALVASSVRAEDAKPAQPAGGAAAAATDPASQLQDRIAKAYKDTKQYQSEVSFEMAQKVGKWVSAQRCTISLQFDRENHRLSLDHPHYYLALDGKTLRVKADQIASRHLAVDFASVDYDEIRGEFPVIAKAAPFVPDVTLLTAQNPFEALEGKAMTSRRMLEPDADKRPGLELAFGDDKITLRVDAATSMVSSMRIDTKAAAQGGEASGPVPVTLTYDIKVLSRNQPIDAKRFAFDAGGTVPVATMKEWVTGQAEAPHPSQGRNAPAISLKTLDGKDFKLADEKADVIILDFWASWCGPCKMGLPKLQAVADWAKKEKKSVAIYTVNMREDVSKINEYWQSTKFTMPVLVDSEGAASDAYGVEGIPHTVIISKGKIQQVHIGYRDDMESVLKKKIESLLAKPAGT